MTKCRLCGTQSRDLLKHLAIVHELENDAQYEAAVQTREIEEQKKKTFSNNVSELKKQKAKGLISAEEYRAAISKPGGGQ